MKPSSRGTCIAIALALTLGLSACGSRSPESELARARESRASGDLQTAVVQLKSALQSNPKFVEARLLLGVIYTELWDGKGAESELRKAQQDGANPSDIVPSLARALLISEDYKTLLAEIKPAPIFTGENLAGIHSARSRAHAGLGQRSEAQSELQLAEAAAPEAADTMIAQVYVAGLAGDLAKATQTAEALTTKHPKRFDAWITRAQVARSRQQIPEAIESFSKAIEILPANLSARFSRATLLVQANKSDEAQKDVDSMRKLFKNHFMVNYVQALIHLREGKYRDAQSAIQQTLKVRGDYAPAILLSGAISHALGALGQAEVEVSRYLQGNPGNIYARKLLAQIYVDKKQGRKALEVIEPVLGKETSDATLLALAGQAELGEGNFTAATERFQQAVNANKDDANNRIRLGLSRLAAGQQERAIEELEAATRIDEKGQADFVLVLTLISQNKHDQAIAAAREVERKYPKNPVTYNLLGMALDAKGDKPGARKNYEQALSLDPAYFPAVANLANLEMVGKDVAAAKKRFENFLAKTPNSQHALLALAGLEAQTGNVKESGKLLERAVAAAPRRIEPRLQLAAYYLQVGNSKQALTTVQEAEAIAPNHPEVLDLLGLAQLANGERNNALSTFRKLAKIAPRVPLAQYRLASTMALLGDYKGAETALQAALNVNPNFDKAAESLGKIQLKGSRYEEAIKVARQLQKQQPAKAAGYVLEGDVYAAQSRFPDALKSYQKAFSVERITGLMVKVYMASVRAGQVAEGDKILSDWVAANPKDTIARSFLADAQTQNGDHKAAAENLRQVVALEPRHDYAWIALAWAYHRTNDARVTEAIDKAVLLKPTGPLVADGLGWLLVQRGKPEAGLPMLRVAAMGSPDTPSIRFHYAAALAATGDSVGARKEIDAALGLNKKFPELEQAKGLRQQLANVATSGKR